MMQCASIQSGTIHSVGHATTYSVSRFVAIATHHRQPGTRRTRAACRRRPPTLALRLDRLGDTDPRRTHRRDRQQQRIHHLPHQRPGRHTRPMLLGGREPAAVHRHLVVLTVALPQQRLRLAPHLPPQLELALGRLRQRPLRHRTLAALRRQRHPLAGVTLTTQRVRVGRGTRTDMTSLGHGLSPLLPRCAAWSRGSVALPPEVSDPPHPKKPRSEEHTYE